MGVADHKPRPPSDVVGGAAGIMGEETAPLIKRKDFRSLSQIHPEAVVVQCCCVESTTLGRVPVIRTLFKKKDPSEKVAR